MTDPVTTFRLDAIDTDDDQPVVMLNLIKFRDRSTADDESGRSAYRRYAERAVDYVEQRGGKALWIGRVAETALADGVPPDQADWDHALLVHYPSRAAFVDMVTSADYLDANVHRLNGIERHLIVATSTTATNPVPDVADG